MVSTLLRILLSVGGYFLGLLLLAAFYVFVYEDQILRRINPARYAVTRLLRSRSLRHLLEETYKVNKAGHGQEASVTLRLGLPEGSAGCRITENGRVIMATGCYAEEDDEDEEEKEPPSDGQDEVSHV